MKRPREEPAEEASEEAASSSEGNEEEESDSESVAPGVEYDLDHDSDDDDASSVSDDGPVVRPPADGQVLPKSMPAAQATIVVVLERCGMTPVKSGKGLLSCIDHSMVENPSLRPDVVHHSLMALMDSPLSKAGRMRVLLNTHKGTCIEVYSKTRVPRTHRRFCGLMAELINTGKVTGESDGEALFRTTPFGISAHIPYGVEVIGITNRDEYVPAKTLVRDVLHGHAKRAPLFHLPRLNVNTPCVFVFAATDDAALPDTDPALAYITRRVSVAQYETNPSNLIGKVTDAVERAWAIL